ncbi:MAG: hypothetical protein JNK79_02085 [Chitinophagaceae bacterium]|nr:hypothetical protein [Chitinophagaceae bacterium]
MQEFYSNRQLAGDMYIDVLPVTKSNNTIEIGGKGRVIDYAVRMRTMDNRKLMNVMLPYGRVTVKQIDELAELIANFHSNARIIYTNASYDLTAKFNDFAGQIPFLSRNLSPEIIETIERSIVSFNRTSMRLTPRLIERVNLGFFRDCHGDLHSGNIYLMSKPVPFDRLEFDRQLREIDVLNEIAFLCMDLEHFEEPDLSKQFFETYNSCFPVVISKEDEDVFLLYRAYRANIFAKINSVKAQQAVDHRLMLTYLENVRRYVKAMGIYLKVLPMEKRTRSSFQKMTC